MFAVLLAGCGRAGSDDQGSPPAPIVGTEPQAESGSAEGDQPPEDPGSDPTALDGLDATGAGSMLSRLASGRPPIAGLLEVAGAREAVVFAYPDPALTGTAQVFLNPTQFGTPRVFRVLDSSSHRDAVQVSLPVKPNGQTGWIARSVLELWPIEHQVLVNLDQDSVTVWDGDQVVSHSQAATGTAWTPTPTGIFFVRDVIPQVNPNGAYGSHILALSGFSDVLDSFAGGLPAIALHGTNRPDTMGQERTNGCVRLTNDIIEVLAADLPLGTPVTIVNSATSLGFGSTTDRFHGRHIF
ncbi:MAG: L,D-transpeptidase [Acidimicrobiia bacterium]|nr:L,D-transpeptidase [Acidimicrobiia bacterium]